MRIWNATEIEEALPFPALVDALDRAFRTDAVSPLRSRHAIPAAGGHENSLLIMPCWGLGNYVGVKLVMVCPGNAERNLGAVQASYLLMDAETGEPRGLMDGDALTRRRTAAASALAARYLARPDARRLLMVGAGQLAPALVAAHAAVRPIEQVEIWARAPEKAEALAQDVARATGLDVRAASDLEAAVRGADVISCATLSTRPLVLGEWLDSGQHLDLVGGFTPDMRECDDAAVARSAVFVDSLDGALKEAGDILAPLASGAIGGDHVLGDLADLAHGRVSAAPVPGRSTLFKSVGVATEDLAAAALVVGGASGA